MGICVVGTSNQLNSEVLKLKQSFQKKKVVTGQAQLFEIGPFCTPNSLCLNIGFWQGSFVENAGFSILVLSTKKVFSKKVFTY